MMRMLRAVHLVTYRYDGDGDDDGDDGEVVGDVAHCCTIFLKSSGYQNIDDRHRNPNININGIIW